MRRAVVFAHYDKDNLIDDYVVYYVRALKKAGCDVVFVSCKELAQTELEKLNGLVIHTITEKKEVSNYPCKLIVNNVNRIYITKPDPYSAPIFLKRIFWNLVIERPFFLRKFATAFMRHFIPSLMD